MNLTKNQIFVLAVIENDMLATGNSLLKSINSNWKFIRKIIAPQSRAPSAWEALYINTGCRASYFCPLAHYLNLDTQNGNCVFGSHSNKWPRTRQSIEASENNSDLLESWFLKNLSCY